MKNIVLYISTLLLMISFEVSGQKPVIDLLPSDQKQVNQYVVADTSNAGDSLIRVIQVKEGAPGPERAVDSMERSRKDTATWKHRNRGNQGLNLKRRQPVTRPARGISLTKLLLVFVRPNRLLL